MQRSMLLFSVQPLYSNCRREGGERGEERARLNLLESGLDRRHVGLPSLSLFNANSGGQSDESITIEKNDFSKIEVNLSVFQRMFRLGMHGQGCRTTEAKHFELLDGVGAFFWGGGGGDTLGAEITVWGRDTLLRGELLKDSDQDWKCPHKNNHRYLDQTL